MPLCGVSAPDFNIYNMEQVNMIWFPCRSAACLLLTYQF